MQTRNFWLVVLALAWCCLAPSQAVAFPILGGGLNSSRGCLSSASDCLSAVEFELFPNVTVAATGSVVLNVDDTVDITLNVSAYEMRRTSGAGSVDRIEFSDVDYLVTDIPVSVTDFGGGIVQIEGSGSTSGSVAGDYTQLDDVPSIVVAEGPFSDTVVSFTNLNCLLIDGTGTCGFTVGGIRSEEVLGDGFPRAFTLDLDGVDHDLVQNFNVNVPEPATALLVLAGLFGLARVGSASRSTVR